METNKITHILIDQYLNGKLDEKAMHELERQALDDPFLADAIEGYAHTEIPLGPQLSLLQKQLEQRIALQQERKNVFNFTWQRISIAAAASLLFISASILFWMKGSRREPQMAHNEKKVEVALTPSDSLVSEDLLSQKEQDSLRVPVIVKEAEPRPIISSSKSKEVLIASNNNKSEKITLIPKGEVLSNQLNEVTIIGYSTQKRTDLTGSVSTIAAKDLEESKALSGRVVSNTGEPLPGVSVRIRGRNEGVSTDANGSFAIKDSVNRELEIASVGYKNKKVEAEPGKPVAVTLEENKSSLNEVAVIGYGMKKKAAKASEPVIGFKKYNKYIEKNKVIPEPLIDDATVVVSFSIDPDGTPVDFEIVRGASIALNNETIRLIKDGPKWKAGSISKASFTVVFKK